MRWATKSFIIMTGKQALWSWIIHYTLKSEIDSHGSGGGQIK